MSLSHRLPHRILSSCSTPRFLVFSNTPSFFSTHYVVPPRPPPALSLIASSSVTVEPQVQNFLSNVESPDFPSPTPDLEEIPVRLPLEKLFLPPEVEVDGDLAKARVLKGSNIVLGPYAKGELIFKADFVKSSTKTEDCPSEGLPEFALVGRSNVGKSSLLNSIVRRKRLALTSKKPGKTQCINHFRINDSWYLVDLPGYGYASAPQQLRTDWDKFTKDYFLRRQTLLSVFLLIDASIPPKKSDLEYARWLGQNQIPMTILFTKCDKRKKVKNGGKRPEENAEDFQSLISQSFHTAPPWILTSSVTSQGRDEVLLHMSQLRNYWLKH